MRKIFLLLVLLWCIVPACASQIPREITDAIPDSARPFLEDTDEADNFTSWNSGLSTLWTRTCKLLASTVQESLGGVILVMSAVLLCSVAEDCFPPLGDGKLLDPVPLVGTLVILLAVGSNMKNLMGLVCDPVAGLVEVPCVKRNVIGAVNAISAADMALAGIESRIPVDEVIDAMGEVGRRMPVEFRETALGGLAATPTGRRVKQQMHPEREE